MVWLFSLIAVSNIAMGYGLAIYFHRNFGTAVPSCGPLRKKTGATSAESAVVAAGPVVMSAAVNEIVVEPAVTHEAQPVDMVEPIASAGESSLPPVDEENVLAGIEEFRSQLAKMTVTADSAEPAAEEEQLAGA